MEQQLVLPISKTAKGVVKLPGSKSISNRALLLAALAEGQTTLTGLLDSDDTRVMIKALQQLGLQLDLSSDESLKITGQTNWPVKQANLFLGNAGTAFRPLTAVLALMEGNYELSGVARMHERPIGDLVDALRALGCVIEYQQDIGYPPLKISPAALGKLQKIRVKGSVSSQFLTSLLMAAPLAAKILSADIEIELDGDLISKPYILITLNLMARFGVQVQRNGWQSFIIKSDAKYTSPGVYHIEGDASSASYFLGLGAIASGPIQINGVGKNSIQGDIAFAEVIESMGAKLDYSDNNLVVKGVNVANGDRLKSFDMDFNLIPDAAMTAAVLALYADGPCKLRNIASWRVKETDRIDAMVNELSKLGATVESTTDSLTVTPLARSDWRAAKIATYDDHRMAMCFSLAAFGGAQVTIMDPDCVSKTYPDYFNDYLNLISQ